MSNMFNCFFSNISSSSNCGISESSELITVQINKMKSELSLSTSEFSFSLTNSNEVNNILKTIRSSNNAGVCEISSKLLKNSSNRLFTAIAYLFNCCIISSSIPNEWKIAVVTPLFKSKWSPEDINNYLAISILPPISKLFEKLIFKQINRYFDKHELFTEAQHGFRTNHSCETALHGVISKFNQIKIKRLIGLLLFIDLKKAYD